MVLHVIVLKMRSVVPMDSLSIKSGIRGSTEGEKRHIDFHFGFCASFKMKNCEKIDEWCIVLL